MKLYVTIVPGGHEVSVLAHLDRESAKEAIGLDENQMRDAEREGDYYDDDGASVHVEPLDLTRLLQAAFQDDGSWFNAVAELVEDDAIANTHDAYKKMMDGVGAIMVLPTAGGFPQPVAERMIIAAFREVLLRAGATS